MTPLRLEQILNRIGDKRDGLDRGVQRQLALRRAIQDVLPRIVPDVRSIPAEAAEFYIVDVRRISFFEYKYELVP